MSNLILDSLEIQNFRAFRHLKIEKLGRVNLIVGKNSVGKTSLLEAIKLYAFRGSSTTILESADSRDENARSDDFDDENSSYNTYFKSIFFGRKALSVGDSSETIKIGAIESKKDLLTISIEWFVYKPDPLGGVYLESVSTKPSSVFEILHPKFVVTVDSEEKIYNIDGKLSRYGASRRNPNNINCVSIPSSGLSKSEAADIWDSIILTDLEKEVMNSLQIIIPTIERVGLVIDKRGTLRSEGERLPIVKIKDENEPLPLRSFGDGISRIFGITVALVKAKDGFLLIDEFENGLHYSVQYDLWKLIFQVARRLNVQVFATTHSWDCIEAFTKAAVEDKQEEGMLIRLQNNEGDIVPTIFDERRLSIATREQIEVR